MIRHPGTYMGGTRTGKLCTQTTTTGTGVVWLGGRGKERGGGKKTKRGLLEGGVRVRVSRVRGKPWL